MRVIFKDVSVTNASAVVPGASLSIPLDPCQVDIDDNLVDSDCEVDEELGGKKSKKRSAERSPASTQVNKKSEKDSYMRRILECVEKESSKNSVTSGECSVDPVRKDMKEMVALVIAAGAEEGSDEHFYATQLLMKKSYRDMFSNLTTPNGRLGWLRRTWEEKNKR